MSFKNTGKNLLPIPMGISAAVHALLMVCLMFLSWGKTVSKPETPPIKIANILLEQEKAATHPKVTKPEKGDSPPLKKSKPFQPTPHHASSVSRITPLPVKPSTPETGNIHTDLQMPTATMVSNSLPSVSGSHGHKPRFAGYSPAQSTPTHAVQPSLSTSTHKVRFAKPVKEDLGEPLVMAATEVSSYSVHSLSTSSFRRAVTARKITGGLSTSPFKGSPAPSVQTLEYWTPTPKTHPVQIAAIPAGFVDEESEALASVSEKPGHPAGETDSTGQDLEAIRKGFSSSVWSRIAKAKYYPTVARKRGWEGKPVIEFMLARNGDLLNSTIALTSSYKVLDEAALSAIKNAAPYPQIPETLKVNSIRFKLPISFILDEP
jgi:TonB family protein